MKCQFCDEEMPEGSRFCPACGRGVDDGARIAEKEAALYEDEQREYPEEKQARNWKKTAIASGCVALMAALALVLVIGVGAIHIWGSWQTTQDPTCTDAGSRTRTCIFCDEIQTEAVEALGHSYVDRKCQNCNLVSYTVSDEEALAQADQVIATLGEASLTNAQLQMYYQMEYINFLNQYYYYLSYFGLDYTAPLDGQECYGSEGYTWQEYFVEQALATWRQYQILTMEADANGYEPNGETQEYLDGLEQSMKDMAAEAGYESADAFLKAQCGVTVDLQDYLDYQRVINVGYAYVMQMYEDMEASLTMEDLETYFNENQETLEAVGVVQDGSYTVDVRHILIKADGTENDDGAITFEDEDAAATAYAEAQRILELWLENGTEEYFAELAEEYSEDTGSNTNGGEYASLATGKMVTQFNDWCFDEDRQVGDHAIVETVYGYHIMYFSARNEECWVTDTREACLEARMEAYVDELLEKYAWNTDSAKIALPYVSME